MDDNIFRAIITITSTTGFDARVCVRVDLQTAVDEVSSNQLVRVL